MHSTEDLSTASFDVELAGAPSTLAEVLPGFDRRDRLGIVVDEPLGGNGASTLVFATVTAFYDFQRQRSSDFWIYPDYFAFLTGAELGTLRSFEVYPAHKEVVVGHDPDRLLEAINDRGITRLLVPDRPPRTPRFEREPLASYSDRVVTAIAYSPRGRVARADLTVRGNEHTERYVHRNVAASTSVPPPVRDRMIAERLDLTDGGRPCETFRRVSCDEALALLWGAQEACQARTALQKS
jgi:hypothetical protein